VLVDMPRAAVRSATASFPSGVTSKGKSGPLAPRNTRQGLNDYTAWFANDKDMAGDYFGYDGPCPPWNDEIPHRYVFTLFALSTWTSARCSASSPPPTCEGDQATSLGTRQITRSLLAEPSREALTKRLAEAAEASSSRDRVSRRAGIRHHRLRRRAGHHPARDAPGAAQVRARAVRAVRLGAAIWRGFENPKNAVRAEWTRLVPMIVVGTALGVTLLVNLPRDTGMLLLGLFVIAFALLHAAARARKLASSLPAGPGSPASPAASPAPYSAPADRLTRSTSRSAGLTRSSSAPPSASPRSPASRCALVAFTLTGMLLDPATSG
jgi:hypothetical protein